MSAPPGTRHAWQVRRLGAPAQVLAFGPVPDPEPGPGEARVAIAAAGLNFPDLLLCQGRYQERPALPFTPGFEAAGVVTAAGPGAGVAPGQQVVIVPELPNGALQDSITVPAVQLFPVPADMPAAQAAVLHIAYQTAHVALHHRGGLRPGQTVVVSGAAGGVGAAAVQLARVAGARVIALATGERKAAACARFGADVVLDLAQVSDVVTAVRAATGGGADIVVDVVGGRLLADLRRCIAFEGHLIIVGFAGGEIGAVPANHVLLRNYSVAGLHLSRYRLENPALLREVHAELVALAARGAITPPVYRELPLDQAPAGLDLLARREVIGRVVLRTPITDAGRFVS